MPPYQVVVWGASGFTGRLVCQYLAEQYGIGGPLRWAIAGRNRAKLEALRTELGAGAEKLPILIGDSADSATLDTICRQCAVVCSTVGPFARLGSELVAACAASGTDYCDITGEVQWIRRMMDAHEHTAQASGARIVNSCGFDSIPSDLGVLFMHSAMRAATGQGCAEIKYRLRAARGGASGGTIASLLQVIDEARRDPAAARALRHPYSLNPPDQQRGPDGGGVTGPRYDPDTGTWIAPFVMAAVNEKIVRRTNALLNYAYGREFRYGEAVVTGRGATGWVKAMLLTAGLGAVLIGTRYEPSRRFLRRFVLPPAGTGPTPEQQASGFFNIILIGHGQKDSPRMLRGRIIGERDPGYGSTSRMVGEAAVCLACDSVDRPGGFWTPAAAMGERLLARLEANAGLSFALDDTQFGAAATFA